MNQTMTIKQISELTGKAERTVRQWIYKPSEKISEDVKEKISVIMEKISMKKKGDNKNPLKLNLDEVISVVKASGNDLLANLLLDNAEKIQKPASITTDEVKALVKDIIKETVSALMPLIQNKSIEPQKPLAIENKAEPKHYTYLTLKLIGENLKPKLKASKVGNMLYELGYARCMNNAYVPSRLCNDENKAQEQRSVYGGDFYAWHKDFIPMLQRILDGEVRLFPRVK